MLSSLLSTTTKRRIRRLLYPGDLAWYGRMKIGRMLSDRVKVGFGPILTGRSTLSARHWHIDPIVEQINRTSDTYRCDAFVTGSRLGGYDLVVFTKFISPFPLDELDRLRDEGTLLIYRAADYHPERDGQMEDHRAALERMDGILLSNPRQKEDYSQLNVMMKYIGSPVINTLAREDYSQPDVVTILWQGYVENLELMGGIRPIIERLARETGIEIQLLFHSNLPSRDEGPVRYLEWRIDEWEAVLAGADIAIAIKPVDDAYQQKKPPSKVISYLAAGLPVVCTPSESDRLVIEDGRTGFFAHDDEEWFEQLRSLVVNESLREQVGRAGREYVLQNHNIDRIAGEYLVFFDELKAKVSSQQSLSGNNSS